MMMRLLTACAVAAGLAAPAMIQTTATIQHGHSPPEAQGGQETARRREPEAHRRGRHGVLAGL